MSWTALGSKLLDRDVCPMIVAGQDDWDAVTVL